MQTYVFLGFKTLLSLWLSQWSFSFHLYWRIADKNCIYLGGTTRWFTSYTLWNACHNKLMDTFVSSHIIIFQWFFFWGPEAWAIWLPRWLSVVKNLPANSGATGDAGSIPGLGKSPGGGNGYSLQYSCLEKSMDRGAWWATVRGVAKSWTELSAQHVRS